MNPILSAVLRRFWTILVLLVIADLVIVLWILNGTLRFNRDNRQLAHAIQNLRTPSPTTEKAALLQKENERLKSDLKMIPGLISKKQEVETEIADQQPRNIEVLNTQSNRIQRAIEQNKKELRELSDWIRNSQEMEKRKKAEARLLEKGLPGSQTPEEIQEEYNQLGTTLQQAGLALKEQFDLRQQWIKSDQSDQTRTAFQPRRIEAYRVLESAMNQLGQDRALYEEIPVLGEVEDPAHTLVLRSIVPDLHGISATVYLDGSVVFSQNKR